MSISTNDDITTLECDICGEYEEFFDFEQALDFKKDKSNNWKCKKIDDEWYDACPDCIDELLNMS
jgi:Fe2+ or Zn2+ uptake regulation protein